MYENPWTFNGKEIESQDISDYFGFVYQITNLTNNRKYIGRKYFFTSRRKKGKKRRIRQESNWKEYYGSSAKLLTDVETLGKQSFKREIISFHKTKGEVNYAEVKIQFQYEVLEKMLGDQREYYNENIANRYFYRIEKDPLSEITKEKISKRQKEINKLKRDNGITHHSVGRKKSEEEITKILVGVRKYSPFVLDNPNNHNIYTIDTIEGIKRVGKDFFSCMTGKEFTNLRTWSRLNKNNDKLHKIHKIKIIRITNPITKKVW